MGDFNFDILTIGDCSIDTFLELHEASLHCKLNREDCQICFKYGDKIPVDNLSFLVGGNAGNTAVAFSRLGLKTAIQTTIGVDELSEKIIKTFKKDGVETRFVKRENNTSSNFSVSINFQGERTIFTHHVKRDNKLGEIPQTAWVYLTSLGDYWQEAYMEASQFIKNNNIKLAFSPGSHQTEGDPALLKEALGETTVLFINKEEAIKIGNSKDSQDIKLLLQVLQKLGPKIISITDGINGSWCILEDGRVFKLGIFPCNIVERTGAGDAYASGFLAGFFYGLPVSTAMVWGAIDAASVIGKVGAQTGLLTRQEIEKKIKENPNFVAKEI